MDSMKSLFVYGAWTAWMILMAVALAIYLVCQGNRFYLPRGWRGWTVFAASILVAIPTVTFLRYVAPLQAMYPRTNEPAPEQAFHLVDTGASRSLHDYSGKVVVLNVWATYCHGCVLEMPDLDRLQQNYAQQGVVVITLSPESRAALAKFAGSDPPHHISAYAEGDQDSSPLVACAKALPMTYIIDSHGVLRETVLGSHDYSFYEQHVKSYLSSTASQI